jgi:hypothetical protein
MLLSHVLIYSLSTSFVTARSSILTLMETSCIVDFRANFRLPTTTQTSTAYSTFVSANLISEWEETSPEFTGYLSYSGSIMCTPTAEPSITFYNSATVASLGSQAPTEFPWSWSCAPDSCATVTSLDSQSQLVVNYGSGGPHWSFTAPSGVVEYGLYTYAYSSGCITTASYMTLHWPESPSTITSTTRSATTTAVSTTTQLPPPSPSTGIAIAAYSACPGILEEWIPEECGDQWEVFPIDNVLQTTTSYIYPGCTPESALTTRGASTTLAPSSIPTLGPFDIDGKSGCSYGGGPNPGLSCITASTLKCAVCPQPQPLRIATGVCGGIFVPCNGGPFYGTMAYCIW